MKVATPWSLNHYIPLNGFHPLYRALFDFAPANADIYAWDNVKLQKFIEKDDRIRAHLLGMIKKENKSNSRTKSIKHKYENFFNPTSRFLTRILPGDIEFHHTAPFPSLTRPFIFHCEAFSPIFLPFAQQGDGKYNDHDELKSYYGSILANPLCLGIFSHIPETLLSFERFFDNPTISDKLKLSRIGLSEKAFIDFSNSNGPIRNTPRFLFINSAHQNPANFFKRGGHIALRFWKEFRAAGREGQLVLRCDKPTDSLLRDKGVDPAFVQEETGKSILWAQGYLANHEVNALMESSDFFLLPSASLHSASILQAMNAGTIPIVTDTLGTSVYVQDGQNGLVLKGMREAIWKQCDATGILIDNYSNITHTLDESLSRQMWSRVNELLDRPDALAELRNRMLERVRHEFSGQAFACQFWNDVQTLCLNYDFSALETESQPSKIQMNVIMKEDWARVFESVPQPVRRVFTVDGTILELGGTFIHVQNNPQLRLEDFSVFQKYLDPAAPKLNLKYNINDLIENLLLKEDPRGKFKRSKIRSWASRKLAPYPGLHSFAHHRAVQVIQVKRSFNLLMKRSFNYWKVRFTKPSETEDIELVAQDIDGFNIVRYYHLFIAFPSTEGVFDIERVRKRAYSVTQISYSFDKATKKIMKYMNGSPKKH